jgi:hypothetical protein
VCLVLSVVGGAVSRIHYHVMLSPFDTFDPAASSWPVRGLPMSLVDATNSSQSSILSLSLPSSTQRSGKGADQVCVRPAGAAAR